MNLTINWSNFTTYNQDDRGIQFKFEDLCRQIFIEENLSSNQQFRYPHSKPNNPGLEIEPIYDEKNHRLIGFQAKYFESKTDYNQIKKSAKKIIDDYTGKVDHVFLFSNKPIDTQSKQYKEILDILVKSNITLELITDNAILDLVRKYPKLGLYYFGNHTINQQWIEEHSNLMFQNLGVRYNPKFNVDTTISQNLSLFIIDQDAVKYINNKKSMLIERIQNLYHTCYLDECRHYLSVLKISVQNIPDIDNENIFDAINWKETVERNVQEHFEKINAEIQELTLLLENQEKIYRETNNTYKKFTDQQNYHYLRDKIEYLTDLLKLPYIIEITSEEQQLLNAKILLIDGEAGSGKSQLLADKTHQLMAIHRKALLLLANQYLSEENIQVQIMKELSLDYSFEDLIDILEVTGKSDGYIIPIFIDALNETWIHRTWKIGLPKIIDKIQKSSVVKLVLTYRPEYATELGLKTDKINPYVESGKIFKLRHIGFRDNSISAITQFLNNYNIPFTPLNFLDDKMSNPLFLTLYCKTYDGKEVDLPKLYESLMKKANKNIHAILETDLRHRGHSEDENILKPLIDELSDKFIEQNTRQISRCDFCNLNYWHDYEVSAVEFINLLNQEQIIYNFSQKDNTQYFYFAYDRMNDYYCASAIFRKYPTKNEVREYLCEKILGLHNGRLKHYENVDLFINACALYAEKYHEECIDIVDSLIDEEDKQEIFSRYISSFQWRKRDSIPAEFLDLIQNCYSYDVIWEMLISNSLKISHPLNANYLHDLLFKLELNKRDYLWTLYINNLTDEKSNRLVELVNMYNKGIHLEIVDSEQIELLLTLFTWLLTSSNRQLRDCTSKAMIEILKENFSLCEKILKKFQNVNDPYVIQRLYGIVFGACCKRKSNSSVEFHDLALYVYDSIFNVENVYPDILLRDYARLIIERYLFEFPQDSIPIECKKIRPPYNSTPILDVNPPDYPSIKYTNGIYNRGISGIINSMIFEGMDIGFSGDFGRYVFQIALRYFKVDHKKIFDYAIYHILNVLGYSESWFGFYDSNGITYSINQKTKTERIGKKYQWIAMYNILARVSDHYPMIQSNISSDEENIQYEGAWDPYVRDFDPTSNYNFMKCDDAPQFESLDTFVEKINTDNMLVDISDLEQQNDWLSSQGIYFDELRKTLSLTDENGVQWISLTKYTDTENTDVDIDKLLIWSCSYAYFVTPEQEILLNECFNKEISIVNYYIDTYHETYTIYNREYPWSPSCRNFEKYAYEEVQINTGGSEKNIGRILHSTTNLIWEEKYDASKEKSISYDVPCAKLIQELYLIQKEADGFFYDDEGNLAAFDTKLTQKKNGVVIRKDLLDEFLRINNLTLIWLVQTRKEIHTHCNNVKYSEWESLFCYQPDKISGDSHQIK